MLGGAADARQQPERAEHQDRKAERRVGVEVDLLHVPCAGRGGDGECHEVERGEADGGVPGEGIADAAIERVGLVLVKAQDVGLGFDAGQAAAQAGDACTHQHHREPEQMADVRASGEERERKRAGREEEDGNPQRPVREAVEALVARADLALVGELQGTTVGHRVKSGRVRVGRQFGKEWQPQIRSRAKFPIKPVD